MTRRRRRFSDWTTVFLGTIERVGNTLPHPATLFAILARELLLGLSEPDDDRDPDGDTDPGPGNATT